MLLTVRMRCEHQIADGLGIGLACNLDGLILVTPFDSLKSVAQSVYPWLPIGPIFRHEIDAASALDGAKAPVAIIAAERDQIVPAARTAALRLRIPDLVFDRTIHGAGHNDIYARSEFQEAMRAALAAIEHPNRDHPGTR